MKKEPEALSGIHADLLEGLEEALLWAKGEKALKSTTLSDNKEQKTKPPFAPVLPQRKPEN